MWSLSYLHARRRLTTSLVFWIPPVLGQMATDEKMRTQPVFVIEDRNNPEAIKEVETATLLLRELAKIVVEYGPGIISIPSCSAGEWIMFGTRELPMTVVHITGHNLGHMTPIGSWITMQDSRTCDPRESTGFCISTSIDRVSIVRSLHRSCSRARLISDSPHTYLFTCAHGFAWTDHSESSNKTKQISH
jgi:hypothetical protein